MITANLQPVKRHDILIDALARLQNDLSELDVQAYLLGEGSLKPELERQ